jgi:hypothetical protein
MDDLQQQNISAKTKISPKTKILPKTKISHNLVTLLTDYARNCRTYYAAPSGVAAIFSETTFFRRLTSG